MKRTIIVDTLSQTVELLQDGYNIIESTVYDEEINKEAAELLEKIVDLSTIR